MEVTSLKRLINSFLKLRQQIAATWEDLGFLKSCLKNSVTPKSHQIKLNLYLPNAAKTKKQIELKCIKESINAKYSAVSYKTLLAYNTHLQLAKLFKELGASNDDFDRFITKIKTAEKCEKLRKRKVLDKKLKQLKISQRNRNGQMKSTQNTTDNLNNIVINKSTHSFSKDEMELLNKGLNYAVTPKSVNKEDIIVDVEAAIRHFDEGNKENIRKEVCNILNEGNIKKPSMKNQKENKILYDLNKKPVYYMKADKGNTIVIMDKEDYNQKMLDKLNNGNFRKIRNNPLKDSSMKVVKTLKECKSLDVDVKELIVANPSVPKLVGLPKIHKEGEQFREIISANRAPTYKIAKWLVNKFNEMNFTSRAIKNREEFLEKTNNLRIEEDELIVSFDVKALFPSVPINESLEYLKDWIAAQNTEEENWKNKAKEYYKLAKLCMEEDYFEFRNELYRTTSGVSMGNPLSPFIAEIFMSKLEKKMEEECLMPRIWMRYVDDIFAIVDKEELENLNNCINKIHKNIEFTVEIEEDGKLPFLDILVTRRSGKIGFNIYRKTTSTQRFIPANSNHSLKHKMAAFNTMIHRMLTTPMKKEDLKIEESLIIDTATKNGYSADQIKRLIKRKKLKLKQEEMSTLYKQNQILNKQGQKWTSLVYDQKSTYKIRKQLRKYKIHVSESSRKYQLKSRLNSIKDKRKKHELSGIYKINCNNCEKYYIGQTKRSVTTRFKEHLREVKKARRGMKDNFNSMVAKHIYDTEHEITEDNLKVIKEVKGRNRRDIYESMQIYKSRDDYLLNTDKGNAYTWLFKLI